MLPRKCDNHDKTHLFVSFSQARHCTVIWTSPPDFCSDLSEILLWRHDFHTVLELIFVFFHRLISTIWQLCWVKLTLSWHLVKTVWCLLYDNQCWTMFKSYLFEGWQSYLPKSKLRYSRFIQLKYFILLLSDGNNMTWVPVVWQFHIVDVMYCLSMVWLFPLFPCVLSESHMYLGGLQFFSELACSKQKVVWQTCLLNKQFSCKTRSLTFDLCFLESVGSPVFL